MALKFSCVSERLQKWLSKLLKKEKFNNDSAYSFSGILGQSNATLFSKFSRFLPPTPPASNIKETSFPESAYNELMTKFSSLDLSFL